MEKENFPEILCLFMNDENISDTANQAANLRTEIGQQLEKSLLDNLTR